MMVYCILVHHLMVRHLMVRYYSLQTENMSNGFWLMATRQASWRAVAFAGSSAVEAARETWEITERGFQRRTP